MFPTLVINFIDDEHFAWHLQSTYYYNSNIVRNTSIFCSQILPINLIRLENVFDILTEPSCKFDIEVKRKIFSLGQLTYHYHLLISHNMKIQVLYVSHLHYISPIRKSKQVALLKLLRFHMRQTVVNNFYFKVSASLIKYQCIPQNIPTNWHHLSQLLVGQTTEVPN